MAVAQRRLSPILRDSRTEAAPIARLLASGGDTRLALHPASGLNIYGCSPLPRADSDEFSSSTASSISVAGLERAANSLYRYAPDDLAAFDDLVEQARRELKIHFGLTDETEIVFARSGTDAQILALFVAQARLGTPLVSIVVGADQTGSGTVHTARGFHFVDHPGGAVKGRPIAGLADHTSTVAIALCDEQGAPRESQDIDQAVIQAVETAVSHGSKVLLQVMASSKLGWMAPSAASLDIITRHWPGDVQVVVDACQMRMGTNRLRQHLAFGHAVLVTGSKFFTGPPFSGALLVPAENAATMKTIAAFPAGLECYADHFDWPQDWVGLRAGFTASPNIGQWLRWEAALEEMRLYKAVPHVFRDLVLRRFADAIPQQLAASPNLALHHRPSTFTDPFLDEEFTVPTIFPFTLRGRDGMFTAAQCGIVHHALNRDMSGLLRGIGPLEHRLAARLCHIGQPVVIARHHNFDKNTDDIAVLRVSTSARSVRCCWSPDPATAASRIADELARLAAVFAKIEFLVANFDRVAASLAE